MSLPLPQTPLTQRALSAASQMSTTSMFTPEAEMTLLMLRRSFSELSNQESPPNVGLFLAWCEKLLERKIALLSFQRLQYKDCFKRGLLKSRHICMSLEGADYHQIKRAEDELKVILKQRQFLQEDIQDKSTNGAGNTYMAELYHSFRLSRGEQRKTALKTSKEAPPRKKFRELVGGHLGSFRPATPETGADAWCLALGQWLRGDIVECAPIVPFSFDTKELSYMFGVEDAALRSPGNGLFLNKVVEKAFDNGWIVIVPDGSVEATPTEWKIVLLKEDIRANTVYTLPEPERGVIRWNVRSS